MLLTLKYIRTKELVTKIDTILALFKELQGDPDVKQYLQLFSYYVEHASVKEFREMVWHKLNEPFEDVQWEKSRLIQNLEKRAEERAEKLIKERIEKQVAERIEKQVAERIEKQVAERIEKQVAERVEKQGEEKFDNGVKVTNLLLTTKKTDQEIAEITGLPEEKIKGLRERLGARG